MKRSLLLILFLFSASTYAKQLTSYQAIEDTLNQGKLITMVFKYRECKIENPNSHKIKIDTAVFKPNSVLMNDEGYLGVAGDWFTTSIPNHEKNGVHQHYKILLNQNLATVVWTFFNPENGQRADDIQAIQVTCELNKGIKVYD